MKAIAVQPGTKTVRVVDRPEPSIAAPDEIKLRVVRVGICGTDREEAAGGRAKAPPAHDDLVLGHEMFGEVTDVGRAVTVVKPGGQGSTPSAASGRWMDTRRNTSSTSNSTSYAWGQSTTRAAQSSDGGKRQCVTRSFPARRE